MSDDRLKGWKEISECLHVGERTAQRWETAHGLPVHRIGTGRSVVVFASRSEVEAWLRSVEGTRARSEPAANGHLPHDAGDGSQGADSGRPASLLSNAPGGRRVAARFRSGSRRWWYLGGVAALAMFVVALALKPQPPQPADPGRLPSEGIRKPALLLRVTFADGARGTFSNAVGALATCTRPGRPPYGIITEAIDGGLRIHVYRLGAPKGDGKPELIELTAFTLRPGEKRDVPGGHDIVAIEWRADRQRASGLP